MVTPTEVECLTLALDPAVAPERARPYIAVWKPAARQLIAALRMRGVTVEDLPTRSRTGDVPGEPGPGEPVMPWLQEDGARRRTVTDLIANIESARDARLHARQDVDTAASRTIGVASLGAGGEEGAPADAVARVLIMGSTMRCCDTACLERAAGLYGALMQSVRASTVCTTAVRGRDG